MKTVHAGSAVLIGLLLSGCAIASAQETRKGPVFRETRAFLQNTCLRSAKGAEAAFLPAIAAAILPSLIKSGLNTASAALKKAGEAHATAQVTVPANGHAYQGDIASSSFGLDESSRCLIVVHGAFGDAATTKYKSRSWNDTTRASTLRSWGLVEDPVFYFEGALEPEPRLGAFKVVARHFEYNENLGGFWGGKRDIVLTFAFRKAGAAADATYALGKIDFSGVPTGLELQASALIGKETAWLSLPPLDNDQKQALASALAIQDEIAAINAKIKDEERRAALPEDERATEEAIQALSSATAEEASKLDPRILAAQDYYLKVSTKNTDEIQRSQALNRLRHVEKIVSNERQAQRLKDDLYNKRLAARRAKLQAALDDAPAGLRRMVPITADVTLLEFKDANPYLAFASQVLEGAAPELETALADQLIPARRQAAKRANEEAAETAAQQRTALQLAALTARQTVEAALVTQANLPAEATELQRLQAKAAVELTMFNANEAYRRAGLPVPYPTFTIE